MEEACQGHGDEEEAGDEHVEVGVESVGRQGGGATDVVSVAPEAVGAPRSAPVVGLDRGILEAEGEGAERRAREVAVVAAVLAHARDHGTVGGGAHVGHVADAGDGGLVEDDAAGADGGDGSAAAVDDCAGAAVLADDDDAAAAVPLAAGGGAVDGDAGAAQPLSPVRRARQNT